MLLLLSFRLYNSNHPSFPTMNATGEVCSLAAVLAVGGAFMHRLARGSR